MDHQAYNYRLYRVDEFYVRIRGVAMDIGPTELLIILVIVVLLFGVGRIGKIAGELGQGLRVFRENLHPEPEASKTSADSQRKPTELAGSEKE